MNQREIYEKSEGDAWFLRNINTLKSKSFPDIDFLLPYLEQTKTSFGETNLKALEIGCGPGFRTAYLAQRLAGSVWGIDPSTRSIEYAHAHFSARTSNRFDLNFSIGFADELLFKDDFFHFIYFGFCLYVIDRHLLDKVRIEADRVLKRFGYLAILDFDAPHYLENRNKHDSRLITYKDKYQDLFGEMGYQQVGKLSLTENGLIGYELDLDKRVAVNLLIKT